MNATPATFLRGTAWADWTAAPITGDASPRQFTRLTGPAGDSAVLMQAPPDDHAQTAQFVRIADLLRDLGLAAPEILHRDIAAGLLLMTDLGARDLATALTAAPDSAATLYSACLPVLTRLHAVPPPADLPRMTAAVAGDMVRITAEYYGDPAGADRLSAATQDAFATLTPTPDRLALRDFHAENLIWRPDRSGTDRIGLIDFQDALAAPAGYDLASLIRDVRRDVPATVAHQMIAGFAAATGSSIAATTGRVACLAAQRNLRILGIFARLARRDGKTRYLAFMPRVWRHLTEDLSHPALTELAALVHATLPPPAQWRGMEALA